MRASSARCLFQRHVSALLLRLKNISMTETRLDFEAAIVNVHLCISFRWGRFPARLLTGERSFENAEISGNSYEFLR